MNDKPQNEDAKSPIVGNFDKVVFKGEIDIFPNKPLPHFDRGIVKAYSATQKQDGDSFALICEKHLVPQIDFIQKYTNLGAPHLPKLLGFGTINWPIDKKDHAVFIYENKMGDKITKGLNPLCLGLRPEMVLNTFFRNLIEVLRVMRSNNFFHGSISPNNIYNGGSDNCENAMLGEMLSVPSGYAQDVLFETIERGLAGPLGRGIGTYSDDIYSFGVTLAVMMRSRDPLEDLTPEEIINRKIEISSFNAIVGQDRFPAPVLELLRGLLHDVEAQRWTLEDILTWVEGQRVSAKHGSVAILKASRPIDFMRKKILRPQHLAIELPKDSASAVLAIENNEIHLWLNRSLQNKEYETRYETAVDRINREPRGGNFIDRFASTVSIALAPAYPIMYKGINFLPAGFGNLLVEASASKRNINPFAEIIQSSLLNFWNTCSSEINKTSMEYVQRIETCQTILRQPSIGYGIERCIYYLAPMAPCLSDKLDGFYVRTPEDYLRAMEIIAGRSNRPDWFLDRHIIAFLSARDKTVIEPHFADLNASEDYRQRQAVLRIFAAIQSRSKMEAMPNLSVWISGMLDCVINRYHDRELREKVKSRVDKIKAKGFFIDIVMELGDFNILQNDTKGFAFAMRQYQDLNKTFIQMKYALDNNKHFGFEEGRQVAMMVSGVIAGLVVIIYLFFVLMGF